MYPQCQIGVLSDQLQLKTARYNDSLNSMSSSHSERH